MEGEEEKEAEEEESRAGRRWIGFILKWKENNLKVKNSPGKM